MRMQIRRLTRLTNAFSKKWENLRAALALYFAWYNFCRIHGSLRVTPAMAAGVIRPLWTLEDVYDNVMELEENRNRAERYKRQMARLRSQR